MSASRHAIEAGLLSYEQKLENLRSYVRELTARVAGHGTDRAHVEEDLLEAEHNIAYYEGEVARLRGELGGAGGAPPPKGAVGAAMPRDVNQAVGTLLVGALCLAAGVIVGSRLLSGRGDD